MQILLQRMETHPEEFYVEIKPNEIPRAVKWDHLMSNVVGIKKGSDIRGDAIFFTDAEIDALYAGYVKIRRKAFDDFVMRRVLDADEQDEGVTFTPNKPPRQILNISTANQSLMQRQQAAEQQAAAARQLGLANAASLSNYPYGAISTGQTEVGQQSLGEQEHQNFLARVKKAAGF